MSVLEEAEEIIHGDRNRYYGHPLDTHGCTAAMWSAYLSRCYRTDIILTPEDVCWMNVLQKVSREANKANRDNMIDAAEYVGNVEMIQQERERRDGSIPAIVPEPPLKSG